ncbi:hypothetical protein EMCRGX_G027074 [Ephydatia muelleri]
MVSIIESSTASPFIPLPLKGWQPGKTVQALTNSVTALRRPGEEATPWPHPQALRAMASGGIKRAERELALVHKMEEWRPWEPLVAPPPPNQWKWP